MEEIVERKLVRQKQNFSDVTRDELLRLRKELKDVWLERDILKKAVSIFSKSDR